MLRVIPFSVGLPKSIQVFTHRLASLADKGGHHRCRVIHGLFSNARSGATVIDNPRRMNHGWTQMNTDGRCVVDAILFRAGKFKT
jgi:hypothetical protein